MGVKWEIDFPALRQKVNKSSTEKLKFKQDFHTQSVKEVSLIVCLNKCFNPKDEILSSVVYFLSNFLC